MAAVNDQATYKLGPYKAGSTGDKDTHLMTLPG